MPRSVALALALALTVAAVPLGAAAGARPVPAGTPRCGVPAGAGWTATPAPDLSSYVNDLDARSGELVAHALDPARPQDRWIASHEAVLRSTDGGCRWEEAVALPTAPTPQLPWTRGVHRLDHLLVGRTDRGLQRVLAVGRAFSGEVVVLRSDDGGRRGSWQALPAPQLTGNLLAVAMAPGDADRLYAVLDRATIALAEVHVSDDGGRSWSLGSSLDLSGQRTAGAIGSADLAIDPVDPDTVLLTAGSTGVLRSTDAGRTVTRLPGGPRLAGALSLHRGPRGRRLAAYERFEAVEHVSTDDGATWRKRGTGAPDPFRTVTHGLTPDRMLAVQGPSEPRFLDETGMSVWRYDARAGAWADITPDGRPLLYDAVLDPAGGFVLHGPEGLWTWHGDRTAPPRRAPRAPGGTLTPLRPAAPALPAPARLDVPARLELELEQSVRVPVRLDVPPRPRDLDLALLFDTTNSMRDAVHALRRDAQQLVDGLAARGNRTRFAVAEFQDYPLAPYGQPANRPYARLRDLAPADAALQGQLAALSTRDDLDVPTSGLTALHQVVTGAGQSGLPRSPGGEDPNIPAQQGMSFSRDAVRVVVTFADEPFHDSPAHPGPGLDETVAALRTAGTLAVGVSVTGRPVGAGPDLRRVAAATGAVAPAAVRCGESLLRAGDPLVCETAATATSSARSPLAAAVVALVDAVPAPAQATLAAEAPAQLSVQVSSGGPVDLRSDSTSSFVVTVRCLSSGTAELPLLAQVGAETVARRMLPVACGGTPVTAAAPAAQEPAAQESAAAPLPPAADPGPVAAALPPAGPPPVVQVPAQAPAPAPAPAQAPAPAPAAAQAPAAAGAAAQERRTAVAAAGLPLADRDEDIPLAAVPLTAGALTTAALSAALLSRRRRADHAPGSSVTR